MKVLMMTNSAYNTAQTKVKQFYDLIKENPNDSSWFAKQFKSDPYEDTGYEMDDFDLDFDTDYDKHSVSNGVLIYEKLKHLPAEIIYSPRFWAWFVFEKAYRQALQISKNFSVATLKDSWFPKSAPRKIIMQGPISREYIKVKMIRELPEAEQESFLKLLFASPNLYFRITERTITDNKDVLHAILKISSDLVGRGISLSDDISNDLLKTVGELGSVVLIDSLSYDEILSILTKKFGLKYPELF